MINEKSDHIKVEGHIGTWYVIDSGVFELTQDEAGRPVTIRATCFLLEHEEYGDEAANVIVDQDGNLLLEDVHNGFNSLEEAGWSEVQICKCAICEGDFPRDEMIFTKDCHGIPFRLVCLPCYERAMEKGYDGEYYTEADECLDEDY